MTHVALGVVAAGPAADAIAQHVPTLVGDRFASRLFAQDATLWGPEAEAESAVRLSWTGLPRSSRPLVGEVSALREHLREQGLDHVVLCGHGRLVAGPRGHLRHGRGGPDGPGLLRPRLRAGRPDRPARAHRRRGLQQVRVDRRDRLPAPRLRGGVHRGRHRPGRAHRRRDRPRQPAGQGGPRRRLPGRQRRPERRRALLRADRLRAGAERPGRSRHRGPARRGRVGRRPARRGRRGQPRPAPGRGDGRHVAAA